MTVTAQSIVRRAADLLMDAGIRWQTNELVRWLNDAQREVATHRPDAMTTAATMTCSEGARQSIPADGSKLIKVIRNASYADKTALRLVDMDVLDANSPNWNKLTPVFEAKNYMFDPVDPKSFYVYPPVAGSVQLDILYSKLPTDIVEPADNETYTAVSGNLTVPDVFANSVLDYIMFRAYSKDAVFADTAEKAASHYAAFKAGIGAEVNGTAAVSPSTKAR